MKTDKKHKKNKSPKRSKKSKKTDRKEKKHKHKEKKKSSKKLEKALKRTKEIPTNIVASQSNIESSTHDDNDYCGPSIDLMNRAKCPETKAEHDHRQSQIKRVVDPETGRIRLIKGDGEILEEIVSRNRHIKINQEATRNDGSTFQKNTVGMSHK